MAAPTSPIFTVTMTIDGDTVRCMPLKQELDAWINRHTGDVTLLPAIKLQRGQPQAALVLRVTWVEIAAPSALAAMTRAAAILREGCPGLIDSDLPVTVTAVLNRSGPNGSPPPLGA